MSWIDDASAPSVNFVTPSLALAAAVSGLALGFSLIVAIGAQNTFVLRQGIRREHVLAVVAICALSDVVLILTSILGTGAALAAAPWLLTAVRIGGALFLLSYAVFAARRAIRPAPVGLTADEQAPDARATRRSLLTAVATAVAVTWLNPHVYLDIAIVGTIANGYGDARWLFGAGIATASVIWFTTLGFGARMLAPVFARPAAWRVLDAVIAVVMATLAVLVALPLFTG